MADKKQQELEERKEMREDNKLSEEELNDEVNGGSITNVNYTKTGDITKKIKKKI